MVIMKIHSGLGNQMFQYATGRAVAERMGVELKLDISSFQEDHGRRYELDRFAIGARVASREDIRSLTGLLGPRNGKTAETIRRLCRHMGFLSPVVTGSYVRERGFHFDPAVLALEDPVYLTGKWQSERYFRDIASILREELQLKSQLPQDRDMAQQMESNESSVSVHVRRGDYVAPSEGRRVHMVLPIEYYKKAIAYVYGRVEQPQFFLFSDDLPWVKENLHLDNATIVQARGSDRGPRELVLMSRCRHHIIANSTFSWWGAWLTRDTRGVICAPDTWFTPYGLQTRRTDDLYPLTWVRL